MRRLASSLNRRRAPVSVSTIAGLNLQSMYELTKAFSEHGKEIERDVHPRHAA